jgi:glycosyltransferase involved in cell wall biosynthesis
VAEPRVLFISLDPVGEEMAGLSIRYVELARALAPHAQATVAGTQAPGTPPPAGVQIASFDPHRPVALKAHVEAADVVVTHPQWPIVTRWLRRSRARVVVDLYDPEALEALEHFSDRRRTVRRLMHQLTLDRLDGALETGHLFVCASEKQRDLWLGAMLARRLIGPELYDRDPSLRSVIDVVPFGVPDEPPDDAGRDAIRERFPDIGPDDEVVLWNGGVWSWLDAPTAIRAVARLAQRRPQVRLVFMGAHSGPAGGRAAEEARRVARDLDVLGTVVRFNDRWVPYDERAAWLQHADCAVSTHRDHLETRFAFRTRLLDCLWAGLPVVCSTGDDLAERVEREGLGAAVAGGDDEALAAALEGVLAHGRAAHGDALARAAEEFRWSRVAEPLARFLEEGPAPRPADLAPRAARVVAARTARAAAYRAGARALGALGLRPPSP